MEIISNYAQVYERVAEASEKVTREKASSDRLCALLYQQGNELKRVNLEVESLKEQLVYLMDTESNARNDSRLGILTVLASLTPAGLVVSVFIVIGTGTTQLIISNILVAFLTIAVYIIVNRLCKPSE